MIRNVTIAALLALTTACGSSLSSVYVKGTEKDVLSLAGQWHGDFKGNDSGRVGEIKFDLALGRHTADGSVLLYAPGEETAPRKLRITYVKVNDGVLHGRIEPYIDAQCNCTLETEFFGDLDGDMVDGKYVTKIASLNTTRTGLFTMTRL